LWYLPALALAAVLAVALPNWPLAWVLVAMGLCFLGGVAITYAIAFDVLHASRAYFGDLTVLHRNGLFTGFPFLMAGMLIKRYRLEDRFSRPVLIGVVVAALALVTGESLFLVYGAPIGVNHDNMLTLALASPAIFLLALKFPRQSRSRGLATYANGLYFLHVAFCVIGFRYTEWPNGGIFAMAVVGSLLGTWGLIRVKLDRKLL